MDPKITCPRCGGLSPSRGRYCAHCGLNLLTARLHGDEVSRMMRRRDRRSGMGVVIVLMLLGLALASLASFLRSPARSRSRITPLPRILRDEVPPPPLPERPAYDDRRARSVRTTQLQPESICDDDR